MGCARLATDGTHFGNTDSAASLDADWGHDLSKCQIVERNR